MTSNVRMQESAPTVDGEFSYALSSDTDLACLEAQIGKLRWQKSLKQEFEDQPSIWTYEILAGFEVR